MSVKFKDYYKLLGVEKTASKDELSKAYKKMARKYHPDLNPNDKEAETRFKEINEAYEVLKDPEKRRLYDSLGPNWQEGMNFQPPPGYEGGARFEFRGGGPEGFDIGGFSDFFETLFGGGARAGRRPGGRGFAQEDLFGGGARFRAKGQDVEADLELTLEEAFRGGSKPITLTEQVRDFRGMPTPKTRSLQVNIPPGITEGAKIRLAGQGGPGSGGGPAGDLFLRVKLLPHPHFAVEGKNLVYDLALAPWEAALGTKVRVETLDGAVDMTIPPGVSSGQKLRMAGKGLGRGANRGDQLVRIMIKVPRELTDRERELWEELARSTTFTPR